MSALPIPGPSNVVLPLIIWFVLTLVFRHPGIAAIVAGFVTAIFFPFTGN